MNANRKHSPSHLERCYAFCLPKFYAALFSALTFTYLYFTYLHFMYLLYTYKRKEVNAMTPKEMEKKIKDDGWYFVNAEGSHRHYKHPTKKGKVTIAFHTQPKGLKTWEVKSILRQAGL